MFGVYVMKHRIFLDTNVFIFAFEYSDSNSNTIIELLNDEKIEVIISERVIKEVYCYFKSIMIKNLQTASGIIYIKPA